jgi:MFS family permease
MLMAESAGTDITGLKHRGRISQLVTLSAVIAYTAGNAFMSGGLGVAGREIGLSAIETGSILSFGALAGVLAAPLWGHASDTTSRRLLLLLVVPLVAAGPAIAAAVFFWPWALAASLAFPVLAGARLVQAASGAALIPIAQSLTTETTTPQQRVSGMGMLGVAISLGTLAGSVLLWLTAGLGPGAGFAAVAGLGVAAFVLTVWLFRDSDRQPEMEPGERAVPLRLVWPNLAITFLGFLAYTMVQPVLGFRFMDAFGLGSAEAAGNAGLVLTAAAVMLVAVQFLVAARKNWEATPMLRTGSIAGLVGALLLWVAQDLIQLAAAMALVGIALGFMSPANLAHMSLVTGRGAQGKLGGLNVAARGLGVAAGPICGTFLYVWQPEAPFVVAAMIVTIIVGLTRIMRTSPSPVTPSAAQSGQ